MHDIVMKLIKYPEILTFSKSIKFKLLALMGYEKTTDLSNNVIALVVYEITYFMEFLNQEQYITFYETSQPQIFN